MREDAFERALAALASKERTVAELQAWLAQRGHGDAQIAAAVDRLIEEGGLIDLALEHDLIQKSGSFFSYGELRLGQGRNNTKQYLAENPELATEIEGKLLAALGVERTVTPAQPVAEAEVAPETEIAEAA